MVIKRSKLKEGNLEGRCRRGQVITVKDDSFQIRFNAREFIVIEKNGSEIYNKPNRMAGVLCIYDNKKRDDVRKIYYLDGKIIYEKKN